VNVTVVWATLEVQDLVAIELPPGATVADAVAGSGLITRYGINPAILALAIFGRRVPADELLEDGDRVELTRPLCCDPKAARARRARVAPLRPAPRLGRSRPR